MIELIDAKTKEPKETLEVDATLIATGRASFTKGLGLENINVETQRGFVLVDEHMCVIDAKGNLVPHLYCIGDANGKLMLAHAASAQGISVVEQVSGKDHVMNHLSIPATCFTHPEISMLIYRADTGEILGVHILGMHADDLIHEASYVMALGTRIQDLKYAVHVHPTLSEVLDELFK
uniref:Pyridine nucleotide-disulphide oxidoreductase dimerisation domain-containing protein n=1 Tax=Lactuca sativa TaxID=4236 RepID=A0A9R1V4Z1_LACSA|nr:hypothetical protein LSAT_V11C600341530 [Lactuca sativa]